MVDIYIGSGIIAITLLIFQMAVLAVAIDIGMPAVDRGTSSTGTYTFVNKGNPANASGTITSIEIYGLNLDNVEVATFFVVSGDNLSTRDTELIGTAGGSGAYAKSTHNVNLDVETGDYLGIYYNVGALDRDSSGYSGIWYFGGDYIPCTNATFSSWGGDAVSVYGTGTTTAAEKNAIFFGTNF